MGEGNNVFVFPEPKDQGFYDYDSIICKISAPTPKNNRHFWLTIDDFERAKIRNQEF